MTKRPACADLIWAYALEQKERGTQLRVPCGLFFEGGTFRAIYLVAVPKGFKPVGKWSDAFRDVWINDEEMAIFSYCEGDLHLTIDTDQSVFLARINDADEFYKEH